MNYKLTSSAVAVTFIVATLASAAAGAISGQGGIGGRPANPDSDNPRTESIFIYTLDKGATKEDAVNVINNSNEKQTIEVYVTDGSISNDGAFACKQQAEEQTGVGKWATLSKHEVTLESMQTEKVDMTVKVPDAVEVGEHNGCVVFQKKNDPGEEKGGMRVQTRSALRLAVTIPGNLYRDVTLKDFSVTQSSEGRKYRVTAKNIGNVSVDADVRVGLRNIFGRTVMLESYDKKIDTLGGVHTIVPELSTNGESAGRIELNYEENTKLFWGGFYTAQATAQYNSDASVIGSKAGHTITKYSDEVRIFIMPSIQAILLMLIPLFALIGLIAWLIGRRYGAAYREKNWGYHTVKQGETIESIARAYRIKWKKLARVNELKAPYIIKPGRRVSVPIKRAKRK